jgi:hypothetical protein
MLLLPFERIRMASTRSAEELVTALAAITRKPREIAFRPLIRKPETATFIGEVTRENVCIHRAITTSRNSFVPYVIGKIVETPSGARIEAIMRPHGFSLGFVALFALIVGPGAMSAIARFMKIGTLDEFEWVPIAMLIALYPMCMLGFVPEARRTKALLRGLAGPDVASLEPR